MLLLTVYCWYGPLSPHYSRFGTVPYPPTTYSLVRSPIPPSYLQFGTVPHSPHYSRFTVGMVPYPPTTHGLVRSPIPPTTHGLLLVRSPIPPLLTVWYGPLSPHYLQFGTVPHSPHYSRFTVGMVPYPPTTYSLLLVRSPIPPLLTVYCWYGPPSPHYSRFTVGTVPYPPHRPHYLRFTVDMVPYPSTTHGLLLVRSQILTLQSALHVMNIRG